MKVGDEMILKTIGLMIALGITVVLSADKKSENKTLATRKNQSMNMLRENIIKKKIEDITNERIKPSKRAKIETLCLQAGFNIDYSEYIMLSILSAVVLSLAVSVGMHNPLVGILFFFMGYCLPGQVITTIRNNRIELLEKQAGSFLNMAIERYKNLKDMSEALELTLDEFRGQEPMYSEIKKTVMDIHLGVTVDDSLHQLARRMGNRYVQRFADYYAIVADVGTDELRNSLLSQALKQYQEHMSNKIKLKKEIRGPKNDAFTLLGTIPLFAAYNIATNDEYIKFMTTTFMGQVGTLIICAAFFGSLWFINAKIGAPIE